VGDQAKITQEWKNKKGLLMFNGNMGGPVPMMIKIVIDLNREDSSLRII
jgi:hypothetical protein